MIYLRRSICVLALLATFNVKAAQPANSSSWLPFLAKIGKGAALTIGLPELGYQVYLKYHAPKGIPGNYGYFTPLEFYRSLSDTPTYLNEKAKIYGYPFKTLFLGIPVIVVGGDGAYREWFKKGEANGLVPGWLPHFEWLLGDCILFETGTTHRDHRSLIQNTMTSKTLPAHVPSIDKVMKKGFDFVDEQNTFAIAQRMTMEAFFSLAGFRADNEYIDLMQNLFKVWADGLKLYPLRSALNSREEILKNIIENELKKEVKKGTILDRLKNPKEYKETFELSQEKLLNDLLVLQFAGQDTTANITSSAICLLAMSGHKHFLVNLRADIKNFFPYFEGLIDSDYKKITSIPYLRAVFYETMRLMNPVNGVIRKVGNAGAWLPATATFPNEIWLPPGTLVTWNLTSNHLDEDVFKKPHEFNPERWLFKDEGQWKINEALIRTHFDAFGGGERVCLGKTFAELAFFIAIKRCVGDENVKLSVTDVKKIAFPMRRFEGLFNRI